MKVLLFVSIVVVLLCVGFVVAVLVATASRNRERGGDDRKHR